MAETGIVTSLRRIVLCALILITLSVKAVTDLKFDHTKIVKVRKTWLNLWTQCQSGLRSVTTADVTAISFQLLLR